VPPGSSRCGVCHPPPRERLDVWADSEPGPAARLTCSTGIGSVRGAGGRTAQAELRATEADSHTAKPDPVPQDAAQRAPARVAQGLHKGCTRSSRTPRSSARLRRDRHPREIRSCGDRERRSVDLLLPSESTRVTSTVLRAERPARSADSHWRSGRRIRPYQMAGAAILTCGGLGLGVAAGSGVAAGRRSAIGRGRGVR
jgi:hypothetical protein